MAGVERTSAGFRRLTVLAALLAASVAAAQPQLPKSAQSLGPVTITAASAEWEQGGNMVYTGNVLLSSENMQLRGDRLQIKPLTNNQYEAQITGNPATMHHDAIKNEKGDIEPAVDARARILTYNSRDGSVAANGNAVLTRGTDEINGESIRYLLAERRIQALGGDGGQVRIVIQPPKSSDAAPADAAPPAAEPPK